MVKHIQTICQLLLTNCWVCLTILWGWCLSSCHMRSALLLGLEISNFRVTKQRFYTKQGQKTYFKNGFHKERVILSSNFQSFQTNPSTGCSFAPPLPDRKTLCRFLSSQAKRQSSPRGYPHHPHRWKWHISPLHEAGFFFFEDLCPFSEDSRRRVGYYEGTVTLPTDSVFGFTNRFRCYKYKELCNVM